MPDDVINQAIQQYPILKKMGLVGAYSNTPGKYGDIEAWPPGETGVEGYLRPKEIPVNSFGVQIFNSGKTKPIDVLADVVSHHLVNTDPTLKQHYGNFIDSLTPDQYARLEKDYQYDVKNYNEMRPIGKWMQASRLPAYFRGYTFNQWPDDFNQKVFTPDQIQLFNQVRQYLGIK